MFIEKIHFNKDKEYLNNNFKKNKKHNQNQEQKNNNQKEKKDNEFLKEIETNYTSYNSKAHLTEINIKNQFNNKA